MSTMMVDQATAARAGVSLRAWDCRRSMEIQCGHKRGLNGDEHDNNDDNDEIPRISFYGNKKILDFFDVP